MKDFQEECQQKWQCDEIELHVKIYDKEHEEHKQDNSNERRKVHVCTGT